MWAHVKLRVLTRAVHVGSQFPTNYLNPPCLPVLAKKRPAAAAPLATPKATGPGVACPPAEEQSSEKEEEPREKGRTSTSVLEHVSWPVHQVSLFVILDAWWPPHWRLLRPAARHSTASSQHSTANKCTGRGDDEGRSIRRRGQRKDSHPQIPRSTAASGRSGMGAQDGRANRMKENNNREGGGTRGPCVRPASHKTPSPPSCPP